MAQQVELLVALTIVGFLENGHVVYAAFMQVAVLVGIHRVDFYAYHAEILASQLAGLADVFHAALGSALACEQQNLFHAAVGNDLHLVFNLLHIQLHALDMVVAVESAVDAIVFAVVGDVDGRKEIDVVAEVLAGLDFRLGGHLFQVGSRGGGEQGLEIFQGAGLVLQGALHVLAGVLGVIVVLGFCKHLVGNVRLDNFHTGQVVHYISTCTRVVFDAVLFRKRPFRKVSGIEQVIIVFSFAFHYSVISKMLCVTTCTLSKEPWANISSLMDPMQQELL